MIKEVFETEYDEATIIDYPLQEDVVWESIYKNNSYLTAKWVQILTRKLPLKTYKIGTNAKGRNRV